MDPVFVKAHRLLFSNEPDSAEQLRGLLDQALKQRYGNTLSLPTVLPIPTTPLIEPKVSAKLTPQNSTDISSSQSEEPIPSPQIDERELALDLLQDELICVICKEMNVGRKNVLVECSECECLYHQECHQPAISDTDTSNPKLNWCCAACKKNMDKTTSPPIEPEVGPKRALQSSNAVGGSESEESIPLPQIDERELSLDLVDDECFLCIVCKKSHDRPENYLRECSKCKCFYHQHCHQPAINDADISKLSLNWYCGTCKKNMDKTLATIKSTTLTSSTSKTTVDSSSKASKKKSSSSSSVPSSNTSSSENLVSKSSTRSAKTASGKIITPVFTIITADQRLQQMKKKAAAGKKGHDKRKREK